MLNRRTLTKSVAFGLAAMMHIDAFAQNTPAIVVATPGASPIAAGTVSTGDVLGDYEARVDEVLAVGRTFAEALVSGNQETMLELFDSTMARMYADYPAEEMVEGFTTRIVSFSMPEAGASFAGPFTPNLIAGFYHQRVSGLFNLMPDEPQDGDVPAGRWSGEIVIGAESMGIEVTFSGTSDDLTGTITIPTRDWTDHPLTNVRFEPERPIGVRIDERVLLMNSSNYGALYEWGDAWFVINAVIDEEDRVSGFTWLMQAPLPDDPATGAPVSTVFRLPVEGAWSVLWGGETEFRNYHASVPQQRHAIDLAIWRDGSTHTGDGTANEDYHCYGQPQYAPAAGTVVTVVDEYPDDPPVVGFDMASSGHPAGNHVVIEVAEAEYVVMAHFQPGSIAVSEGDVVAAGDLIGLTGNSGNSSEPHIHIQLQLGPDILDPATISLPMEFEDLLVNGVAVERAPLLQGQIVERGGA